MLRIISLINLIFLVCIILIVTISCGGGGGDGDSGNDGTETIAISDIEGLWTVYFTEDDADTANRMQVIYLTYADTDLYCSVEGPDGIIIYTAELDGASISMQWGNDGSQLRLSGEITENEMSGAWSDNNQRSGVWEAIYGLDLQEPIITLNEGNNVLFKIKEVDDLGTVTFYGTDPGNVDDVLITRTNIQTDMGEIIIDTDEDGEIAGVIFTDTVAIINHYPDGSIDYEIQHAGEVLYTGAGLNIDMNGIATFTSTRIPLRSPTVDSTLLIKGLNSEELKPTFKDSFNSYFSHLMIKEIEIAIDEKFFQEEREQVFEQAFIAEIFDNDTIVNLGMTYHFVQFILIHRLKNRERICNNSSDFSVCLGRAAVVNDILNEYFRGLGLIMRDLIRQEWENYNDGDDAFTNDDFTTNLTKGTWKIQLRGDSGQGMKDWVTFTKIYFQGIKTDDWSLGQEGNSITGTYQVKGIDIEIRILVAGPDEIFDLKGSFRSSSLMGGTWTTPSPGFESINSKQWTGTWNEDG